MKRKQKVFPLEHALGCVVCKHGDKELAKICTACINGKGTGKFQLLDTKELEARGYIKQNGAIYYIRGDLPGTNRPVPKHLGYTEPTGR